MSDTARRLSALARASSLLRSGLPSRRLLQDILDLVPEILPADAYAIWRHDGRRDHWTVVAATGLTDTFVHLEVAAKREGDLLLHGPFVVPDLDALPLGPERGALYEAEGIRQMFVIPLHVRGEAAGTLACYHRTTRAIDDEDRFIGAILGEVVSTAINARKFDRFAEAARVVAESSTCSALCRPSPMPRPS